MSDTTRTTRGNPSAEPSKPEKGPGGFEITRTELVWPGKYDQHGNLVEPPRVALPFQVIEVIEEGRTSREGLLDAQMKLFGARPKGPADEGWRNKLIWGDNLLVETSLLKDFAGKIDLIYIDPPFATGADFSYSVRIGSQNQEIEKGPSLIEEKAYRDNWAEGTTSYLKMIAQRILIMRELLTSGGSLFLHCDWHVGAMLRLLMDEIFGADHFVNEIVWYYYNKFQGNVNRFAANHDTIFWYKRGEKITFHPQKEKRSAPIRQIKREWDKRKGAIVNVKGLDGKVLYQETDERAVDDVWRISMLQPADKTQNTGYPTQKPETILERIILSATNPNDLVADFFCGSGTTMSVAEKFNRRWIGCDLGRFAIHTTRKRLLDLRVKDPETNEERGSRPFEILNLGRYERKYWQGITFGNEPRSNEETALAAYVQFILDLYKAQPIRGTHIHGKKGGALVHVGAVDAPVTISQIEEAAAETKALGAKELHILGWEFEMGLHDPITQYVRVQHQVSVRLLSIPRETMEKRAVEAGDIQFFDLAYLEVELTSDTQVAKPGPRARKAANTARAVKVVLKNFVIPSTDLIPEEVRAKIRKWSDYIDYWAVDWDFRNDTFVNQWQTYRTRKDRSLALETPAHAYERPGSYQILVKVVDIFGNDTSHLVRWEVK